MLKNYDGKTIYPAKVVYHGCAAGEVLKTSMGLSFWGGVNPQTGKIIDAHHELFGTRLTGKIFCFPSGSGSSSNCGVLMEMVRCGTHPAAIINIQTEAVLALGPIVAHALYGRSFPIVNITEEVFSTLKSGDHFKIDTQTGRIEKANSGNQKL